jgi:hypothetical protein
MLWQLEMLKVKHISTFVWGVSIWFSQFSTGCHHRMGQDWRPDEAIRPHLIQPLFQLLNERIAEASTQLQLSRWIMTRALFTFLYVFSLHGNEGLLTDS